MEGSRSAEPIWIWRTIDCVMRASGSPGSVGRSRPWSCCEARDSERGMRNWPMWSDKTTIRCMKLNVDARDGGGEPESGVLVVGHGTRDAAGIAEFHEVVRRLAVRLAPRPVAAG